MLGSYQTGWDKGLYSIEGGIPMELLFGKTSAVDCVEAIWWYCAFSHEWFNYIPSTGASSGSPYFRDGVGYWIKAEKECTLEISGVVMENAPFTPPEYPIAPSWNLLGFTGSVGRQTQTYLQSLTLGCDYQFYGPIWVWCARTQSWMYDPDYLYPTYGFWMYYKCNSILGEPTLAP
jgi:hypothetical protein